MSLNARQEQFVREYLLDLNATAAYKRAGYKPKNDEAAQAAASRLLSSVMVQRAIKSAQRGPAKLAKLNQKAVLDGLLKEAQTASDGPNSARVKAWELLGKHLGMFEIKIEHRGEIRMRVIEEVVDSPGGGGQDGAAAPDPARLPA